jgi:hypothetical protein
LDSPKEKFTNVYDYILEEETDFKTRDIPLGSNWKWNMYKHVDLSFHLVNSQFYKNDNGQDTFSRPFNQIILPIRNVNVRSEGFDIKDIEIFVDNKDQYYKSFIARKFHNAWAKKYGIDNAIDESVESYFDYGLALVKNVNNQRPEVIQLQQIAFCDQTDILAGPICLKHQLSIDQIDEMKGKWYDKEIDKAILMSKFSQSRVEGQETKTPGKYIEVYELHGMFPESWLGSSVLGEDWTDTGKYVRQMHIVTYHMDSTDTQKRNGICLFKGKVGQIFKAKKRDPIFGRACGRGGIEELFHTQVWTNYSMVQIQQMLEAVAKVLFVTNDPKLKNQNLKNQKHLQVIEVSEGKEFKQLGVTAPNEALFANWMEKLEQIARTIGSASDPQLGLNPTSGTPLGTTEIVTQQGMGIHDYRKGKIAEFWGEIYRDWVISYLEKDINAGDEWLDELSLDELREVAEKVAISTSNSKIKSMLLEGKLVTREDQAQMIEMIKKDFMKGGRKRFLQVVKNEFKNLPLSIEFSIASKQKNLFEMVSKLNGVFRTLFANPQIIAQNEGLGELLNQILEYSGFSPINFSKFTSPPALQTTPAMPDKPMASPISIIS